jgi:hypothetical protein
VVELLPPACALAAAALVALSPRARIAAVAVGVAGCIAGPILQGGKMWTGMVGIPRADFVAAGDALRTLAPAGTLVVAPVEIAAQANRRTPIHYPEIEGVVRLADRASREHRLGALLREAKSGPYAVFLQRAQNEWRGEFENALGSVRAAVIDPTQNESLLRAVQTFPVSTDDLVRRGFHVVAQIERYTVLSR